MSLSTPLPRPFVLIDERPWGRFSQYAQNATTTVKLIEVLAGEALSLQRHQHRDELWVALDDGLVVEVGGEVILPRPGQEIWIPRGTSHRARAQGQSTQFIEVAFGAFDEHDIERLEDAYGRS